VSSFICLEVFGRLDLHLDSVESIGFRVFAGLY
jgi:hypothetical protein